MLSKPKLVETKDPNFKNNVNECRRSDSVQPRLWDNLATDLIKTRKEQTVLEETKNRLFYNYPGVPKMPDFPKSDITRLVTKTSRFFGCSPKDEEWTRFVMDYGNRLNSLSRLLDYWESLLTCNVLEWGIVLKEEILRKKNQRSSFDPNSPIDCIHESKVNCFGLNPYRIINGNHFCYCYWIKVNLAIRRTYYGLSKYFLNTHYFRNLTKDVVLNDKGSKIRGTYVEEVKTNLRMHITTPLIRLWRLCRIMKISPYVPAAFFYHWTKERNTLSFAASKRMCILPSSETWRLGIFDESEENLNEITKGDNNDKNPREGGREETEKVWSIEDFFSPKVSDRGQKKYRSSSMQCVDIQAKGILYHLNLIHGSKPLFEYLQLFIDRLALLLHGPRLQRSEIDVVNQKSVKLNEDSRSSINLMNVVSYTETQNMSSISTSLVRPFKDSVAENECGNITEKDLTSRDKNVKAISNIEEKANPPREENEYSEDNVLDNVVIESNVNEPAETRRTYQVIIDESVWMSDIEDEDEDEDENENENEIEEESTIFSEQGDIEDLVLNGEIGDGQIESKELRVEHKHESEIEIEHSYSEKQILEYEELMGVTNNEFAPSSIRSSELTEDIGKPHLASDQNITLDVTSGDDLSDIEIEEPDAIFLKPKDSKDLLLPKLETTQNLQDEVENLIGTYLDPAELEKVVRQSEYNSTLILESAINERQTDTHNTSPELKPYIGDDRDYNKEGKYNKNDNTNNDDGDSDDGETNDTKTILNFEDLYEFSCGLIENVMCGKEILSPGRHYVQKCTYWLDELLYYQQLQSKYTKIRLWGGKDTMTLDILKTMVGYKKNSSNRNMGMEENVQFDRVQEELSNKLKNLKKEFYYGLKSIFKLWAYVKLKEENPLMRDDVQKTYVNSLLTQSELKWYSYDISHVNKQLGKTITKNHMNMMKNIRSEKESTMETRFSGTNLSTLFYTYRTDETKRGFVDWMRLILCCTVFSSAIREFQSVNSAFILHLNQSRDSHHFFEFGGNCDYPFLFYSGGRYQVFFAGKIWYKNKVPEDWLKHLKERVKSSKYQKLFNLTPEYLNNSSESPLSAEKIKSKIENLRQYIRKTITNEVNMRDLYKDPQCYCLSSIHDDTELVRFAKNTLKKLENRELNFEKSKNVHKKKDSTLRELESIVDKRKEDSEGEDIIKNACLNHFSVLGNEELSIWDKKVFCQFKEDGDSFYDTLVVWVILMFDHYKERKVIKDMKDTMLSSCEKLRDKIEASFPKLVEYLPSIKRTEEIIRMYGSYF